MKNVFICKTKNTNLLIRLLLKNKTNLDMYYTNWYMGIIRISLIKFSKGLVENILDRENNNFLIPSYFRLGVVKCKSVLSYLIYYTHTFSNEILRLF